MPNSPGPASEENRSKHGKSSSKKDEATTVKPRARGRGKSSAARLEDSEPSYDSEEDSTSKVSQLCLFNS
jgi:hypothetical protein